MKTLPIIQFFSIRLFDPSGDFKPVSRLYSYPHWIGIWLLEGLFNKMTGFEFPLSFIIRLGWFIKKEKIRILMSPLLFSDALLLRNAFLLSPDSGSSCWTCDNDATDRNRKETAIFWKPFWSLPKDAGSSVVTLLQKFEMILITFTYCY